MAADPRCTWFEQSPRRRRTGIPGIEGTDETHQAGGGGYNSDREHVAEERTDICEALHERATSPEACTIIGERVVGAGRRNGPVGPAEGDARDDPVKDLGHLEAHDRDGVLRVVHPEDCRQRDEAGHGRAEARRDLVDCEPRDADAGDGDGEGVDGHVLEDDVRNRRDTEADAESDVDETNEKVARAARLPRPLDRTRGGRDREHDAEEEGEAADGVDAIRLRGEVAAELLLHARCHVRVVKVADEESDTARGHDARGDQGPGTINVRQSFSSCIRGREVGVRRSADIDCAEGSGWRATRQHAHTHAMMLMLGGRRTC